MTISVTTGSYGFTRDWTLNAYGKNFYLGQDVKFCVRVLGMHPKDLIDAAGVKSPCDLRVESNRKAIARTICRELGITRSTIKSIEPWGLCAQ
jgi:hypothetical protein